jgi:hypothetical protein
MPHVHIAYGAPTPIIPACSSRRVSVRQPIYSVRVGLSYRALGLWEGDTVTWYWIGPHDEYDALLTRLLRMIASHRQGANCNRAGDRIWRLLLDETHVLDVVSDEPLEERFVIFGELDFGLIFGVER